MNYYPDTIWCMSWLLTNREIQEKQNYFHFWIQLNFGIESNVDKEMCFNKEYFFSVISASNVQKVLWLS